MSRELWDELKQCQERVEAALRDTVPKLAADAPAVLVEAMCYSLFAPGKRLRPLLAILACEAAGGSVEVVK